MLNPVPDLVLVGGGHAHVQVLKRFKMKPIPGLRVTLITPDVQTPYSGMLPGYVSGFYTFEECHIDLVRLAEYCDARFVHARATSIDLHRQQVVLQNRPPVPYDVLSLNIGIAPTTSEVPGAPQYSVPVKPISTFSQRFEKMLEEALKLDKAMQEYKVAVVGGGPTGVELACAVQYRLTNEREKAGISAPVSVAIISRRQILNELAPYARKAFLPLLKERNITVYETQGGAASVDNASITLADGTVLPFDTCLWCTQAGTASWLAESGLPTDSRGFLLLNEYLQADQKGLENVFGAGDCTTNLKNPRPKAGVYAVRAGMPLADNIAAYIENKPLKAWTPQSTHLNLISAGNEYAVAVKGSWLGWQGSYLWRWKDSIDRKFMDKFGSDLDFEKAMDMSMAQSQASELTTEAALLAASAKMRCGGCGAKVGASTLSRVLEKLQVDQNNRGTDGVTCNSAVPNPNVVVGLSSADDAAVLAAPPPGHVTIHSVDFFRAIIKDPYLFGSIAANHALSDCYAMGASPTAAMAIAVVPFASEEITERDLYQLMAGANAVFNTAGCALVGGHSCEGAELSLGFSIYGTARPESLLRKNGLEAGHALILTKGLGTGLVFAGAMRGLAQGRWVAGAVESMLESNAAASEIFRNFDASACTDITGFGLLGHLAEMAKASKMRVEVDSKAVPLLNGAWECANVGASSSLQLENSKVASVVDNPEEAIESTIWPLLIDPQTSGGLLAAVPAEKAEQCVAELKKKGCRASAVIGRVLGPVTSENGNADHSSRYICVNN